MDGVADVQRLRFFPVRVGGHAAILMPQSFSADRVPDFDIVEGDPEVLRDGLMRGEAAVGSLLALRLDASVGDVIELETPSGPQPVRVAAIITEYTTGGSALYLEWGAAERLFGPHRAARERNGAKGEGQQQGEPNHAGILALGVRQRPLQLTFFSFCRTHLSAQLGDCRLLLGLQFISPALVLYFFIQSH